MASSIFPVLVAANDEHLDTGRERFDKLLRRATALGEAGTAIAGAREVGYWIESLVSAFVTTGSNNYRADWIHDSLTRSVTFLRQVQHGDGSFDSGNRHSPPDTAFIVRSLAASIEALRMNEAPPLREVLSGLEDIVAGAKQIVIVGGVHTPNHRWIMCDALARVHSLMPDSRLVDRVDEWLSEGIDIDEDGQYSERSVGIYSAEVDRALISIGSRLGRESLFDPVRRNLSLTLFFMEPNGEVQTIGSRRQDQYSPGSIARYYLPYRFMGHHDADDRFSAVADRIETLFGAKLRSDIIHFVARELPEQRELAAGNAADEDADYARVFPAMGVVRVRRKDTTATILGGTDWPRGVASGLSSSPTFFTYRRGDAILESVRLVADFFSKGYFRSTGLRSTDKGFLLEQVLEVPYYQPLSPELRRPDGLYDLTPAEDRFYSRMSFPLRKQSEIKRLSLELRIVEQPDAGFLLAFTVSGCDNVPVAVELAFRTGGALRGASGPLDDSDTYGLESGFLRYEQGGSTITVGPGRMAFVWGDDVVPRRPGYLAPPTGAVTVYITGYTPFEHVLEVR